MTPAERATIAVNLRRAAAMMLHFHRGDYDGVLAVFEEALPEDAHNLIMGMLTIQNGIASAFEPGVYEKLLQRIAAECSYAESTARGAA